MRERASINSVSMRTLSIVYPQVVYTECFSHTIDCIGGYFKIPILSDFIFRGFLFPPIARKPGYCGKLVPEEA